MSHAQDPPVSPPPGSRPPGSTGHVPPADTCRAWAPLSTYHPADTRRGSML
jgi:hypothetical protein